MHFAYFVAIFHWQSYSDLKTDTIFGIRIENLVDPYMFQVVPPISIIFEENIHTPPQETVEKWHTSKIFFYVWFE